MMFDHMAAAQRVGIPGDKLERLVALARAEFPTTRPWSSAKMQASKRSCGRT